MEPSLWREHVLSRWPGADVDLLYGGDWCRMYLARAAQPAAFAAGADRIRWAGGWVAGGGGGLDGQQPGVKASDRQLPADQLMAHPPRHQLPMPGPLQESPDIGAALLSSLPKP